MIRFRDLIRKAKEYPMGHVSHHADGTAWKKVSMKPPRWEQVRSYEEAAKKDQKRWEKIAKRPRHRYAPVQQTAELRALQKPFLDKAMAALEAGKEPFHGVRPTTRRHGAKPWTFTGPAGAEFSKLRDIVTKLSNYYRMPSGWEMEELPESEAGRRLDMVEEAERLMDRYGLHMGHRDMVRDLHNALINFGALAIGDFDSEAASHWHRFLGKMAKPAEWGPWSGGGEQEGNESVEAAKAHEDKIYEGLPIENKERTRMLAYAFSAFSSLYDNVDLPDGYEFSGAGSGEEGELPDYGLHSGDKIASLDEKILVKGTHREAGNIRRRLIYDLDQDTLSVYHASFFLKKFAQGEKPSIGKAVLKDLISQYKEMGVDYVKVTPVQVGVYAWARFGFDWSENSEDKIERRYNKIRRFLTNEKPYQEETKDADGVVHDGLGWPDEKADKAAREWSKLSAPDLASLEVDGVRLGRRLMLSKFATLLWSPGGTLDLKGEGYERFKRYIGE